MKVIVTGATGTIGRHLVRALAGRGDAVVGLSRRATTIPGGHSLQWDPAHEPIPAEALSGADAIVNLAGRGISDGRWSDGHRRDILDSRLSVTRHCASAIGADGGPTVLISGSAIGYYGTGDEPVDERSGPGSDFLAEVCVEWEDAARAAEPRGRVVLLRTGIVLARDGGALPRLLLPARLGAGGPLAGGQQWQSWIHIDDEVGIIIHALTHDVAGPVNAVAPNAVRQRDFARQLGRVISRPALLPTPALALRVALGGAAEIATKGQHVLPTAIQAAGYTFEHPQLSEALRDLLTS